MIVEMLPLLFALIISSFRFLIIFRRSVYWLEAKNAILPLQILCAVIFFFLKHSPCSNLNTVYLIDDPSLLLLQENGHDEISIKAMGRAINKTVMVVELIKRRVGGLHQNTVTESVDITDTWEPLEEGLLPLETTRHVSMITVTLSKKPLDTSSPGYQPPIPAEEVKPAFDYDHEESYPPGRGRGRGGGRRGRGRGMFFLVSSIHSKVLAIAC